MKSGKHFDFASVKWAIRCPQSGCVYNVRGLRKRDNARFHALKHFILPEEKWEQLSPKRAPSYYMNELKRCRLSREVLLKKGHLRMGVLELLNDMALEYVETTRAATERKNYCVGESKRIYGNNKYTLTRLIAVSQLGVFVVFQKGTVSDLVTSYRPIPGVRRGALTTRHFFLASLRKFNIDMARSGTSCMRLP